MNAEGTVLFVQFKLDFSFKWNIEAMDTYHATVPTVARSLADWKLCQNNQLNEQSQMKSHEWKYATTDLRVRIVWPSIQVDYYDIGLRVVWLARFNPKAHGGCGCVWH